MKTGKAVKTFWKKVYQQIFQTDSNLESNNLFKKLQHNL